MWVIHVFEEGRYGGPFTNRDALEVFVAKPWVTRHLASWAFGEGPWNVVAEAEAALVEAYPSVFIDRLDRWRETGKPALSLLACRGKVHMEGLAVNAQCLFKECNL